MTIGAIDLFAGAGGLSLGALQASVDVRLAVDNDPIALATLEQNGSHYRLQALRADLSDESLTGADLRRIAGFADHEPLLVIGGAPCQPFSKAAYWTDPGDDARYRRARAAGQPAQRPVVPLGPRPDERRSLVSHYWRIVQEARADGFVFENVPSLLHPRNRHTVDMLIHHVQAAGFHTTLVRANAVDFGVPQRRERVFLLASRHAKPVAPRPTHALEPSDGRLPAVTAGEAFARLGAISVDEPEIIVNGRWAQHLRELEPGWNYKWHTAWAGHPNPTWETETRFWSFLLKLHPRRPAWTVPANPGPWVGPFHWDSRRLTTAELAILQDFPIGYTFAGDRRQRVRQIGNAVPPGLARRMIEQVLATIPQAIAMAGPAHVAAR